MMGSFEVYIEALVGIAEGAVLDKNKEREGLGRYRAWGNHQMPCRAIEPSELSWLVAAGSFAVGRVGWPSLESDLSW